MAGKGEGSDPLTASERDKYWRMWNVSSYHRASPGQRQLPAIEPELRSRGVNSIVEIGCGTGRLGLGLHLYGYSVHMIDIVENALDADIRKRLCGRFKFSVGCAWELEGLEADATVSCDVLEHLPPDRIDQTLDVLKGIAPHGFHGIALHPDVCGRAIGETLHLTVQPAEWWEQKFEERFDRVSVRRKSNNYCQVKY